MYFLVYAIFMCELQKIFFLRDMIDNQCADIFSIHATIYGSHSVKFAFTEGENIFSSSESLFFFVRFVCFYLSPPPKFSPKLFFLKLIFFFLFL